MKRFASLLLVLMMLFGGFARSEEVGFATPEDALCAWLTALKYQDFSRAASCFATESIADHFTEEVLTNGRSLPVLSDGGSQVVLLIPHEAYRELNVANLHAHAVAVTMYAASALAATPDTEFFEHIMLYNLYNRYYPEERVTETLALLETTDFQQLESLVIHGSLDMETYLLLTGCQAKELSAEIDRIAAEIDRIVSAYGAQDARPVMIEFEVAGYGRCMVAMYALQYQNKWYLLGPSRLLAGMSIGFQGSTGIILPK